MVSWLKKHYHWIIVIVMMLQTAIYGGLANNLTPIYVIPVTEDLGISRGDYSLAISMRSLVIFVAVAFSGPVFQRFGVKKPIVGGLAAVCLGYSLLAICDTPLTIGLACAAIGLGETFIGVVAANRIVNNWFHRYRGSVFGLITACTGLGGGILSVWLSSIIATDGWRMSRICSGICVLVTLVLAALLLRENPSQLQLAPLGEGHIPKKKTQTDHRDHWMGYSMAELVRKPTFYLALVTFFLAGFCIYSTFSIIAPHLQNQGMSASDAALQNGLMLIFLAVFKFGCGMLSDKIGAKSVCIICMVFAVIGLWMMCGVHSMLDATIAIFLYSISVPIVLVVISLVTYPLFGYRSHDASLGIFQAMPALASLVSVPVANAVYDQVGSYIPVFQWACILGLIVIGLLCLLYMLTQADRKKYAELENLTPQE